MKKLVLITFALLPSLAQAQGNVIAHVTDAGVYGSGRLFIRIDQTINEPGCETNRFDVAPGHPQIDAWLAIAMTAITSGRKVKIVTDGCYAGYPTIGNTTASYFYLRSQ